MPRTAAPLALALLIGSTGCSLSLAPAASLPDAWVSRLGGPAETTTLPRVEAAARRLAAGGPPRLSHFLVAANDRVGAWSWPDGTVVLTRKLLDALDDDELVAVLAHELGHLELDARPGRRALEGSDRRLIAEEAADDAGRAILTRCSMNPALMPRMLRHVAVLQGIGTEAGRSATARAAHLEQLDAEHPAPGTSPGAWR